MRIATRSSPLAMHQASLVVAALSEVDAPAAAETQLVQITTEGDQHLDRPISQMAGRGVFVTEVQNAVLDGRAQLATHSAKDLRSAPTPGLLLVGCLKRADARDALVGSSLADLPNGATVATGSTRRQSQLANLRPDLRFINLRGNIATRIEVAQREDVAAVIVAMAALERLGLQDHCAEALSPAQMLPQAGQGAIAIECRQDDHASQAALAQIIDPITTLCVTAERAVLAELADFTDTSGGCDLPVGALATLGANGSPAVLELTAMIASPTSNQAPPDNQAPTDNVTSPDNQAPPSNQVLTATATNSEGLACDGEALGRELARHLLEDLGGEILLSTQC